MTVSGQSQVTYGYDHAHRLTSIAQGSASVGFTYDNADRRTVLTLPNGVTVESAYDAASQLTGLTYKLGSNTLGDLTYTHDVAGNRLTTGGGWARTGLPAAMASATYDAANQISTWASTSFTYDANGNLTDDGIKTYTWNARNQLTGLGGGVTASFGYDAVGRRRGKTIMGTTTNFLYDARNFVQELSSGGTPPANLLMGLRIDETFSRTDSGGTDTLLTDALDSVLEVADASGTLQTHYTYEPFGATTVSGTSSSNSAQFTGRENDSTGLMYYRARYYSSTTQRFVSEDPLLSSAILRCEPSGGQSFAKPYSATDPLAFTNRGSQRLNVYSFVENNPLTYKDPLGLDMCENKLDKTCYVGCFMALLPTCGVAAAPCLACKWLPPPASFYCVLGCSAVTTGVCLGVINDICRSNCTRCE
jgi:RHS repeat-associated protein